MISKTSAAALAIFATSAIASAPASSSAEPVCTIVTQVYSGPGFWVPEATAAWKVWSADPSSKTTTKSAASTDTWGPWDASKSTTTSKSATTSKTTTVSTETWAPWDPSKSTTTSQTVSASSTGTWAPWESQSSTTTSKPVIKTSSTTSSKPVTKTSSSSVNDWEAWSSSTTISTATTASTTTTKSDFKTSTTTKAEEMTTSTTTKYEQPTTTTASTTTTTSAVPTTTTSAVPTPSACPAGSNTFGGSCKCTFDVKCDVGTTPDFANGTKFFTGIHTDTLAACNKLCDDNEKCTATLYVEDKSSGDYQQCYQTSKLPQPDKAGVARISYKGACSGTCSSSYDN